MKKIYSLATFFLVIVIAAGAQKTDEKIYNDHKAGDAQLLKSWAEWNGRSSEKVFNIKINDEARYYISALANLPGQSFTKIKVNGKITAAVFTDKGDWKWVGSELPSVLLKPGVHEIRVDNNSPMVPMVDDIFFHKNSSAAVKMPEKVSAFFEKLEILKRQTTGTEKVLPNPEGNYDHAIDTTFTYSHYSTIYLAPGIHTFTTSGSTTTPNLVIFTFPSLAYSGANTTIGPNESTLAVGVASGGYYAVMLRPATNGASGISNIQHNGNNLVSNAVIGGRTYNTATLKGGMKNFFTCRLSAGGDTRMIVSRYSTSSARAYNDDYSGTGTFSWGLASRIKKDFVTDSVRFAFVCAYSATSGGTCDIYMGNDSSDVTKHNLPVFPLLEPDDAIKAAPESGNYNCIAWSGGISSSWSWPPDWSSTYNCSGSNTDVTCFDNFYGNNPLRYPGAQTYTRSGANSANASVDLWALNGVYKHGSVRKPGNNHPHGYDWESKPGGLTRTFHPRTALTNYSGGYGTISNYYRIDPNARSSVNYATDEDAVKAGVAVFDVAKLTDAAQAKLRLLIGKIDPDLIDQFNKLYEAWDKTKEENALYSDPAMYCKNSEFETMISLAKKNARNVMILSMDKFVNNNDHFIGELLWSLSKTTYSNLLTEVKQERTARPNDEQGRYRIHGDHDNGVLYVEKILKDLQPIDEIPVVIELTTLTMSPNPVSDRYMIKLVLPKEAMVSVKMVYAQSRQTTVLQHPAKLSAGVHIFTGNISKGFIPSGEMITVQAEINGEIKTIKAIVLK